MELIAPCVTTAILEEQERMVELQRQADELQAAQLGETLLFYHDSWSNFVSFLL